MNFDIHVSGEGSRRVVSLSGECDIATAPRLKEALAESSVPGVDEIIIDMQRLEFLDSSGLGVIVGALKRLRENGGTLKVAGAAGPSRKVFQLTGLDKIIPLFDDVESAAR